MDVGEDNGAAKAGHGVSGVGTTRQGGVRSAEAVRGVKAGGDIPRVELFLVLQKRI